MQVSKEKFSDILSTPSKCSCLSFYILGVTGKGVGWVGDQKKPCLSTTPNVAFAILIRVTVDVVLEVQHFPHEPLAET